MAHAARPYLSRAHARSTAAGATPQRFDTMSLLRSRPLKSTHPAVPGHPSLGNVPRPVFASILTQRLDTDRPNFPVRRRMR